MSGPSNVCTSNKTFLLDYTPSGSMVTWSVTPSTRVLPSSGNGSTTTFYLASCNNFGNTQITFSLMNTFGGSSRTNVTKGFIAGGPDPQDVELDIYKSTGGHANKHGST